MLQKVELGSTLRNILLQLATLKFVAWQVERLALRGNNKTMLRDKLNENVARITWPLQYFCSHVTRHLVQEIHCR